MAYDQNTYVRSPFGASKSVRQESPPAQPVANNNNPQAAAMPEKDTHEALSDLGEPSQTTPESDRPPEDTSPALPSGYAPVLKSQQKSVSCFYLPKGRIGNLNLMGEAVGWLMAWGTVGFFRAYIPPPVLMLCDRLFTPWGMAGVTLFLALLLGQSFRRYQLRIASARTLATTAIEYGEAHHRADAQNDIHKSLSQAEAQSKRLGEWLVTALTALSCLFIIGAFY